MCKDMNELVEVDVEVVDVPLEDGTIQPCAIVDEFEIEDQGYIVLSPIDDDDVIGMETYYFRSETEGDDVLISVIEDEEELALVKAAHLDWLEEEDEEAEEE